MLSFCTLEAEVDTLETQDTQSRPELASAALTFHWIYSSFHFNAQI